MSDAKFRGMGFGYDANGRMVRATKANVPDALSVYDAAGMRVAERVNDVWRFSIYDIGGKIVAEYGGVVATDEGGVKYLLSDWQGSTRAATVQKRCVNLAIEKMGATYEDYSQTVLDHICRFTAFGGAWSE